MPLQLIHEDITKMKCDAIVNPSDCFFSGGGGADMAIHQAAGPQLDMECARLEPINVGEVVETGAYNLPCRYVIHTMGPVWDDGDFNEEVLLRACYTNALFKAAKLGVTSIAFPLISSGTFGFPKDKVLKIANDAISDFLMISESNMDVYICVIDKNSYELGIELGLNEFLNGTESEKIVDDCDSKYSCEDALYGEMTPQPKCSSDYIQEAPKVKKQKKKNNKDDSLTNHIKNIHPVSINEKDLSDFINKQDDSFALLLFKLMDLKEMEYVTCYKKANVSKNTFSKINNEKTYKPSKQTVLAFAVALELNYDETVQLLKSAGFAFSGNSKFDRIVEYFIRHNIYDIFEINAALFKFDQKILG